MITGLIIARGGSKRIPKKNIKTFHGKPIIAYSIEAALKADIFEQVIVSTDSEEIAEVAKKYGAKVPFIRPASISDDDTPTASVISHSIEWYSENEQTPDSICCIYATAPFLQPKYLKKGYDLLQQTNCTSSFSVTTYAFPIARSLMLDDAGYIKMVSPEYEWTRSQDLPERYHDAGQFYWLDVQTFIQDPRLYSNKSIPVVIPRYLVQDIDTEEDWIQAEKMFLALDL
jgi:pseudaminic acid cytidylyltransferase